MTGVTISVPPALLVRLEARAKRLRLSRSDYLRKLVMADLSREKLAAPALIEAAPELLKQLKFAARLLRRMVGGASQVVSMEATISKAEGGGK